MATSEHEELIMMECAKPNGTMKNFSEETVLRSDNGKPSRSRTLVGLIYYVICMFSTAYTTIVVNDKRPDPLKHPPLPDVILDSISFRVFPRKICAASLTFLAFTSLVVLLLHKQRQMIFRRYVSNVTSLYLWRCLCMLGTGVPVTHSRFVCATQTDGSFSARLRETMAIILTLGATPKPETATPVVTCGDFMYSGHTITYIFLAYYITRYSRNLFGIFHPLIWIASLTGIISLFASFFHYTMDIAVSVALCPIALTLHEILVENPHLRGKFFVFRVIFPLLNYLEGDRNHQNCVIYNDYDWSSVKATLSKYMHCLCNDNKH